MPSLGHPLRQNPGASVIAPTSCAGIADRRYPGQALRVSRPIPAPERPTVGSPRRPPARESPTVSTDAAGIPAQGGARATDAPPFPRTTTTGLPTLPHSRAQPHPNYRRSLFPALPCVDASPRNPHITDAPGFWRRSSAPRSRVPEQALLSNLPRHRQPADSIPTAFRKRKLTFSCFSIEYWWGLPKVGPWIS